MPPRRGAHDVSAPYELWKKLVIGTSRKFMDAPGMGGNRYYFERAKFGVVHYPPPDWKHDPKRLTVVAEVIPDLNTLDDDGLYLWGVSWPEAFADNAFRVGAKVNGREAAKAAAEACVRGGREAARELLRGPLISDDVPA
jgi:hypothetical protein